MTRRRRHDILLAFAATLFLATACSPTGSAGALEELRAQQRQWQQQNIADYSYVLQRSCFCGPELREPVRIEVRGGERVAATYVATGERVADAWLTHFPTIDGLFDFLMGAFARADSATATYHATHGAPREVSIDYQRNAIDDELALSVRDVTLQ